jgi:uncharacterized membrane protein YkoI
MRLTGDCPRQSASSQVCCGMGQGPKEQSTPVKSVFFSLVLAAGLFAGAVHTASADRGGRERDDDQEKVWEARKRGTILPLETILASLLRAYPGEILKIDLDDDDDYLIYEIEILTRRGIVLELEVDAHTGRILDIEEDD